LFLERLKLLGGDPPGAYVFDEAVEFRKAALERPHECIGCAGEPALKYAHREPDGGAVQNPRAVVVVADVIDGLIVKGLLADLAGREIVAKGIGDAPLVDLTP
jgi:hypothetical protein